MKRSASWCALVVLTFLGLGGGMDARAATDTAGAVSPDTAQEEQDYVRQLRELEKSDDGLPRVLIIGDSVSNGYTGFVRELLAGQAHIIHNPGNSQGTTHTLANLDRWLSASRFDLIHFNMGLHDLKRVKVAGTAESSRDPRDPRQADLPTYAANLEKIVRKLEATGTPLIFATTTPFPAVVKGPHRDAEDVNRYNAAALQIMKRHGIAVNDLHGFVLPRLEALQKPRNVHYTPEGYAALGNVVARKIAAALKLDWNGGEPVVGSEHSGPTP